jgi:hypothetical protein
MKVNVLPHCYEEACGGTRTSRVFGGAQHTEGWAERGRYAVQYTYVLGIVA